MWLLAGGKGLTLALQGLYTIFSDRRIYAHDVWCSCFLMFSMLRFMFQGAELPLLSQWEEKNLLEVNVNSSDRPNLQAYKRKGKDKREK